jgi:hypothetical protein
VRTKILNQTMLIIGILLVMAFVFGLKIPKKINQKNNLKKYEKYDQDWYNDMNS